MKNNFIVEINECDFGSTGNIAKSILLYYESKGIAGVLGCCSSDGKFKNKIPILKNWFLNKINAALCRFDGSDGFHNYLNTYIFLKKIDKYKPTVIHLHNIHGHYINLNLVFKYAKKHNINIFWTLHDCWVLTGRCPHFESINCSKWKTMCRKCPSRKQYPGSKIIDGSKLQHKRKIRLINKYKEMITFICPSDWLKNLILESRISQIKTVVINNGIDLIEADLFDNNYADKLIKKHDLTKKSIFMFAADDFSNKKGIYFLNKLADELNPCEYAFLVAGIKNHSQYISKNIIDLGFLNKKQLYTAFKLSKAFVNPTLEDNFPTVNIEALANGIPVICFKTGGATEMLSSKTGIIIEKGDYHSLKHSIETYDLNEFNKDDCIRQSRLYSKEKMNTNYFNLMSFPKK